MDALAAVIREPVKVIVRGEPATEDAATDNRDEKYGGVGGSFLLEGELLVPRANTGNKSQVALFMHPTASMTGLPFIFALAARGLTVCVANSRYSGNDSALVAEKCVLDVGYFVKHLRQVLGYSSVILGGWSGGGALMSLYQSQATSPSITRTPSGDAVDMKRARLIPGDMLLLVAAHTGRASFLAEALDPTIWLTSRQDASTSHPELQSLAIYGANATNKPPYSAEFLAKYRAAQRQRMERITAWAKSVSPNTAFVVEGTMADPRWMDLNIDRNERGPAGNCFLGECEHANDIPAGLARFCTARGWLSQWADGVSEMDAVKHLPRTNVPTLVVVNGADDGVPSCHGTALFRAIKHEQKEFVTIKGAQHYFIEPGSPPKVQRKIMAQAVDTVLEFINRSTEMPLRELQSHYAGKEFPSKPFSKASCSPIRGPSRGMSHIALVCSDMKATVKFYGDVLGMPVVKTIVLPDGGQHFFLDCGDSSGGTLAFFWWPKAPRHAPGIATASKKQMASGQQPQSASGSMNHLAFQIAQADIKEFRKHIKSQGVWVSPIVYHADNEEGYTFDPEDPDIILLSIYLWGPDGELLEFAASTDRMYPRDVAKRVMTPPGRVTFRVGKASKQAPKKSKL